jgi:drug/metabolite transporter (DMT)-like permease
MQYLGETAAIGAAVTWSSSALFFTTASKRIGSFSMSHYRMLFGTILLVVAHVFLTQELIPANLTAHNVVLLASSGLLGYFLCDTCLFQMHVDIGPRRGVLIFSFYPFAGAILARFILGEVLSASAWLGIAITLGGILFAVSERHALAHPAHGEHFTRGILLGIGAVIFQGASFTAAKSAMTSPEAVDALTATIIRAVFGGSAFWLVSMFRGRVKMTLHKVKDKRAMGLIGIGAAIGPALGVWLSMVSIKLAPVGIASTLMALMPITILPMTWVAYKEKITLRAIIGAVIACIGAAILFNA